MNATIDSDIFNAWSFERDSTADLILLETRRALERASSMGRTGTAFAAGQLAEALCPAAEAKAARMLAKTREIFESHGAVPTEVDDNELRSRFQKFLEGETALIQAAIYKLDVGEAATRKAQTVLEKLRVRADYDFKLMLISMRTAAAKAQLSMNISHSNVQVGDHNTQNNQVTVLRDILSQIDASQHTEAQKAEAKGKMTEFLTNPIVVSVVGDIAKKVLLGS